MVFLTGCDGSETKKLFLFSGFVDFTMIATLKPYKKGKKEDAMHTVSKHEYL